MRLSCQSRTALKFVKLSKEKAHQKNCHENTYEKYEGMPPYGIEKVTDADMPG